MKILITGTTGYIAKRLVLKLQESGHQLVCCVRDLNRIPDEIENKKNIEFIKVDFLNTKDVVFSYRYRCCLLFDTLNGNRCS